MTDMLLWSYTIISRGMYDGMDGPDFEQELLDCRPRRLWRTAERVMLEAVTDLHEQFEEIQDDDCGEECENDPLFEIDNIRWEKTEEGVFQASIMDGEHMIRGRLSD